MIQKRRVHDMNWFYKHCTLDSCNRYEFSPTTQLVFPPKSFHLAGKEILVEKSRIGLDIEVFIYTFSDGDTVKMEEWMFEPLQEGKNLND